MTFHPWRFLILFALVFAVLEGLYLAIPDELLRSGIYPYGFIKPSLGLLHLFSRMPVIDSQNYILLGTSSLEIVRGCDAINFLLLSVAALLAFPATYLEKIIGIGSTIFLLWLLNLLRIIFLIIAKNISNELFDFTHQLLMPCLFCLCSLLMFVVWLNWIKKSDGI